MARRISVLMIALALVAPACGGDDDGARRYVIDVDAKSTAREKFQFSAYFPPDIRVAAGDTIRFRNRSTEAPHTITFGVLANRSNQPEILIPEEGENPAVTDPCVNADEPTPEVTECDSDELGPFDGSGYWNSGFLQPKPAPKDAGPKTVSVRFADDISAGEYTYVCILHPLMAGVVQVVEDRADRSEPSDIRDANREGSAEARGSAEELEEPEVNMDGDTATMAAGWGDRIVSVNRFAPAELEVDAGTTVRWEVQNPYEPHTVTFESEFEGLPPEAFTPGGVQSGEDYTGGFANSGLIASGGPFEGTFSLRFPQAGTYGYTCVLHPGMDGTVKVT